MSSPQTPRGSRHSSTVDAYNDSPQERRPYNDASMGHRSSSFNQQGTLDMNELGSGGAEGGNGMGNLADELADAFSDSGDDGAEDDEDNGNVSEGSDGQNSGQDGVPSPNKISRDREDSLSVPPTRRKGHQYKKSAYDGSDYGSESDLDSSGMAPSFVAKVDAIESLARRGTENYGGETDDVVKRVTEALRHLGSQSTVEGSASRLITAHSALTTHLTHQTRQMHGLTFPILSHMTAAPDPKAIEELVPLLVSLSDEMARPSTAALDSLSGLHAITADLVQTLNYLSDTLHMSRQTTATATRRLKSAKELVAEVRRDDELREEGELWLTRGNWGERLQKRECAGVCGEVIGGFEEVCNSWRERLLAQAESQA
ncbi:Conserved hypothetical, protein [Geosmithia morbida]|uniref:Conserved hypothetical, protein n=1 Tax=Geosmithia morbida TaxID=1094350 RepID=A0A9P5D3G7_9HYPO|nr:Conserved hypothetical, protein [Geosmithia morbida]KAF4121775.1 Conserved hypothetical, protein [Geosmithia morbida]